jgi:hypothetical protein
MRVLRVLLSIILCTLVEHDELDDIDVYLIRAGAETFERPMSGAEREWTIGEPTSSAYYVTLSQIVSFPQGEHQSQVVYRDWERRVIVGVPTGYGVLQLIPDEAISKLKAEMSASRRRG